MAKVKSRPTRRLLNIDKLSLLVFAFLCWPAAFGINAHAQEVSNAVLIDEFNDTNCERQRAQVDNLLAEIKDSPDSRGIIIIHGESNDPVIAYKQKLTVLGHLQFRQFDLNRIVFVLGQSEPRIRTELWKVPTSELNRFQGDTWNFKIYGLENAVLIHSESWLDGIGCSYTFDLKFYAAFLAANNDLTGRIIIRDKSIARYNRVRARTTNELARKYKISKNQLEFAFIQSEWQDVEYWYIPSNLFIR